MKNRRVVKEKTLSKMRQDIHGFRASDLVTLDCLDSIAMIQDDGIQKRLQKELIRQYVLLEKRVDSLLKNTLPEMVANEIKHGGRFAPRSYDCTILFSDIVGFTRLAESMSGELLIELLDGLFKGMDDLVMKFKGTKIKTIGDAYMAVFGAPHAYADHAVMAVKTGLALLDLVDSFSRQQDLNLQVRIGIHTGTVMAGVVGKERMQFDIFGDHVNIASRFESSGEQGRVNVSYETYIRSRDHFDFEQRGEIALKNKANMSAYFVVGKNEWAR